MTKYKKVLTALVAACCLFALAVAPVGATDLKVSGDSEVLASDSASQPGTRAVYFYPDAQASQAFANQNGAQIGLVTLHADGYIDTTNRTGWVSRHWMTTSAASGCYFSYTNSWTRTAANGEWAYGDYTFNSPGGNYSSTLSIGFLA